MTKWQPIESYDRPRWERVLLADTDGDVGVGYLTDEDDDWIIELEGGESCSTPTHWMPLPAHPAPRDDDGLAELRAELDALKAKICAGIVAASCDTQPKGGDAKQAPFMSGAVGSKASDAPNPSSETP